MALELFFSVFLRTIIYDSSLHASAELLTHLNFIIKSLNFTPRPIWGGKGRLINCDWCREVITIIYSAGCASAVGVVDRLVKRPNGRKVGINHWVFIKASSPPLSRHVGNIKAINCFVEPRARAPMKASLKSSLWSVVRLRVWLDRLIVFDVWVIAWMF